jgi:hypothetical protein
MPVSYVKNSVRIYRKGTKEVVRVRKFCEKRSGIKKRRRDFRHKENMHEKMVRGWKKEGQIQAWTIDVDGTLKKSVKGLSA